MCNLCADLSPAEALSNRIGSYDLAIAFSRARLEAQSTPAQRGNIPSAVEFASASFPTSNVGHPIGDPLAGTAHREVPVGRADISSQTQTVVLSISSSARPSLSGEAA